MDAQQKLDHIKSLNNARCRRYYKNNKTRLSKKYECECGGRYTILNKSQHLKTQKHKKFLEPKQDDECIECNKGLIEYEPNKFGICSSCIKGQNIYKEFLDSKSA